MKLYELVGVKKFKDMTRDEIGKHAQLMGGWKRLGSGAHGHAYEKDGVVYKFWFQDAGYEAFVEFCSKNKSKFLPKFLTPVKSLPAAFAKHITAPDKIKYVKMEKLAPFNPSKSVIKIWDKPRDGRKGTISFTYFIELVTDSFEKSTNPSYEDFEDSLLKRFFSKEAKDKAGLLSLRRTYAITEPDAKELLELLIKLREVIRKAGLQPDMKEANYAMRGDQPIIIDPFMSKSDNDKNFKWKDFERAFMRDKTPSTAT